MKAYEQVMGAVLVSKIPLSTLGLESLHSSIPQMKSVMQKMKPLLVSSEEGQPIQILHQSLHDLLTDRAHLKDNWKQFAVNEQLHHQRLALLCLQTIDKDLSENTPGTGYLFGREKGIPNILEHSISEHLKYACRFWMDHLLVGDKPSQETVDVLHNILVHKFNLWLELIASIGLVKNINPLIAWIDVSE